MGGNGTASVNGSIPADEQQYISLGTYQDPVYGEIEIVEWTATNQNKAPEESNSAPRMYATFDKNGKGVNEIAKYGADHKKEWAIHTVPHNKTDVNGPHVHSWSNGRPIGEPTLLTSSDPRYHLLQRVQNFNKLKK